MNFELQIKCLIKILLIVRDIWSFFCRECLMLYKLLSGCQQVDEQGFYIFAVLSVLRATLVIKICTLKMCWGIFADTGVKFWNTQEIRLGLGANTWNAWFFHFRHKERIETSHTNKHGNKVCDIMRLVLFFTFYFVRKF